MKTDDVLDKIGSERARLLQAIEALGASATSAPVTEEGWTAEDVLAHLVHWLGQVSFALGAQLQPPSYVTTVNARLSGDEWNARAVDHYKSLSLDEIRLEFEHLASRYGFASTPTLFTAAWFHFDNETARSTPLATQRLVELRALIPSEILKSTEGSYFRVALQVSNAEDLALRTVNVYLQNRADQLEIVGIERAP